jgi:hypothetical protein
MNEDENEDVNFRVQLSARILRFNSMQCIMRCIQYVFYLRNLAEHKELHPHASHSGSKVRFRIHTQVLLHGIIRQEMKQRGCRSNKPNGRKGGQSKVPAGHDIAPVPWFSILKVGLTSDNEESVHDNGSDGDPQV